MAEPYVMPLDRSAMIRGRRILVAFVLVCVMIDLFPQNGSPAFRYTGSDPTREVWNVGWPLSLAIYDPQSGIHDGPFLYVVAPVQAVFALSIFVVLYLQKRPPSPST